MRETNKAEIEAVLAVEGSVRASPLSGDSGLMISKRKGMTWLTRGPEYATLEKARKKEGLEAS